MSVIIITPAIEEPLTLSEVKKQQEVADDFVDDDDYLNAIITEVREYAEKATGRSLINKTYKETLREFPYGEWFLEVGGAHTINSIKYQDAEGVLQTIPEDEYEYLNDDQLLEVHSLNYWPATQNSIKAVEIEYIAGYGNAAKIPPLLKKAMLLLAGTLYNVRENHINGIQQNKTVISADNLLNKFKIDWL